MDVSRYQAFLKCYSFPFPDDIDSSTCRRKSKQQRCMEIAARCFSYIPVLPSLCIFCERRQIITAKNLARLFGVDVSQEHERKALIVRLAFLYTGCGFLLIPVDLIATFLKGVERTVRNKKGEEIRNDYPVL
jgi:hypothetical protein